MANTAPTITVQTTTPADTAVLPGIFNIDSVYPSNSYEVFLDTARMIGWRDSANGYPAVRGYYPTEVPVGATYVVALAEVTSTSTTDFSGTYVLTVVSDLQLTIAGRFTNTALTQTQSWDSTNKTQVFTVTNTAGTADNWGFTFAIPGGGSGSLGNFSWTLVKQETLSNGQTRQQMLDAGEILLPDFVSAMAPVPGKRLYGIRFMKPTNVEDSYLTEDADVLPTPSQSVWGSHMPPEVIGKIISKLNPVVAMVSIPAFATQAYKRAFLAAMQSYVTTSTIIIPEPGNEDWNFSYKVTGAMISRALAHWGQLGASTVKVCSAAALSNSGTFTTTLATTTASTDTVIHFNSTAGLIAGVTANINGNYKVVSSVDYSTNMVTISTAIGAVVTAGNAIQYNVTQLDLSASTVAGLAVDDLVSLDATGSGTGSNKFYKVKYVSGNIVVLDQPTSNEVDTLADGTYYAYFGAAGVREPYYAYLVELLRQDCEYVWGAGAGGTSFMTGMFAQMADASSVQRYYQTAEWLEVDPSRPDPATRHEIYSYAPYFGESAVGEAMVGTAMSDEEAGKAALQSAVESAVGTVVSQMAAVEAQLQTYAPNVYLLPYEGGRSLQEPQMTGNNPISGSSWTTYSKKDALDYLTTPWGEDAARVLRALTVWLDAHQTYCGAICPFLMVSAFSTDGQWGVFQDENGTTDEYGRQIIARMNSLTLADFARAA